MTNNAKFVIDALQAIVQHNANTSIDLDRGFNTANTDIIFYGELNSMSNAQAKRTLKTMFAEQGLALGKYSNDGEYNGKTLVSVIYTVPFQINLIKDYMNGTVIDINTIGGNNPVVNERADIQTDASVNNVKQSAYNILRELILSHKQEINDDIISKLTDKDFSRQAGLTYALFLEVDYTTDYKAQTWMNGKNRYSKKILDINNRQFYLTNHIFHKQLPKLCATFEALFK